ncbi:unnamed protein product, partial [Ectocarpus sp. 13 AM-2016]
PIAKARDQRASDVQGRQAQLGGSGWLRACAVVWRHWAAFAREQKDQPVVVGPWECHIGADRPPGQAAHPVPRFEAHSNPGRQPRRKLQNDHDGHD